MSEFAHSKRTDLTPESMARGFDGRLPRIPLSIFYHLGLLVVAFAMLLLPLVYLTLIGAVGYGLYYHAVFNVDILSASGANGTGKALAYFGPLAAGATVILFMVKPLFARSGVRVCQHVLKPEDEPLLFAFVHEICRCVRAPKPRVIQVDCEVNASASFRPGLWGFLRRDLVLTIGLPLVAGLDTRQLAGVLAHEFGHFSQGAGMRLTYIIRHISMWFVRVVYERDQWDVWLENAAKKVDLRIGIVIMATRAVVWMSRRVLWVLMVFGHGISCFMMRQMEYDADLREILLAGSHEFEQTAKRLRLLGLAAQIAQGDLEETWRERRLSDDFASFVVSKTEEIPERLRLVLDESAAKGKTSLFDTHPSDAARVRRAVRRNAIGICRLSGSPADLFANYEETARIASLIHYNGALEMRVSPEQLVPAKELAERVKSAAQERKAYGRYFRGLFNAAYPLEFPQQALLLPADPEGALRAIKEARQRMMTIEPAVRKMAETNDGAYDRAIHGYRLRALLEAGFKLEPRKFGLSHGTREEVDGRIREAHQEMMGARTMIDAFAADARARLVNALALLHHPKVAERVQDPSVTPAAAGSLHAALVRLSDSVPAIRELQRDFLAVIVLFDQIEGNEENADLHSRIRKGINTCHTHLQRLHSSLRHQPYPLEHAEGDVSLSHYILGDPPGPQADVSALQQAGQVLNNFYALQTRLMGRLAMMAEKIEEALGLQPLPEPVAVADEERAADSA